MVIHQRIQFIGARNTGLARKTFSANLVQIGYQILWVVSRSEDVGVVTRSSTMVCSQVRHHSTRGHCPDIRPLESD